MTTRRGRAVAVLGVVVYLAAWTFGSRALYPVSVGLVLVVVLASAWVRFSARPPQVRRHGLARDVVEGDNVRIDLEVTGTGRVAPPTMVAHERPGSLGERRVELHRVGRRRFAATYDLWRVPRGRYAFDEIRLTIEDPFALARTELVQGEPQALVVYPRLVHLDRLFSDGGAHVHDGRRLLLRRPSGYELHGVREYVEGESLRKVHWRTTARRGTLMVRELEDAPRDEIAVLLDGFGIAGEAFEVAVRAAGSLVQANLRRGRRCALQLNSALRESQVVGTEGDWRRALELLAAAEPTARTPAVALLQADGGLVARSLELIVVTAHVDVALADRLVQRALSRRRASVVHVDLDGSPKPQLLRLQAAGVPVAVVRAGEPLADALAGREARVA
ncbi:MAG TPA: DUF58 domain-containing protein [Gaiellaceae bacterium]|nr:DUF58 domain-containing protein [Gaiellaceae bacterium]